MPSRQFHGKSRHGCRTCKKRKVRCDLGRPVCANCTRLSRECIYADQLDPAGGASPTETAAQLVRPPAPHSVADSSEGWAPTLIDLELMHYFTAHTSLATDEVHDYLWTVVIPKMGFQHPFLLHGILAVAAMQKRKQATEPERSELLDVARDHQQRALSEYIPILVEITEKNCHALFAFSQTIAAMSYALLQLPSAQRSAQDFVQGIVAVFDLLIGTTVIAVQGREWLRAGELAPMMGHGPALLDWNMLPLSDEPKVALASLIDRIQSLSAAQHASPESSEYAVTLDCCISAIDKLRPLFPRMPQTTPRKNTVIGWPVFVDTCYIALLKLEDEAALVVLAYYGVTIHALDHVWWLNGLGAKVVQAVSEIVSEEWAPYLVWPKNEVAKSVAGGMELA